MGNNLFDFSETKITTIMKTNIRTLLTVLFAGLFYASAFAQVGRIEQTTVEYEKNNVDALTVTMKPERKDIQKAFDDWMDDRYNINMKGGGLFGDKNLRSAEDVNIPAISTDNISFFTETEEVNGETRMTIFASYGLSNFIEADDYKAYTGLEDIFDGFLSSYLPEYYEERVAEARKELEDFREEVEETEKDIRENEERITDLQRENEEKRSELKELERKIADAKKMLDKREEIRREVRRQVTGLRNK